MMHLQTSDSVWDRFRAWWNGTGTPPEDLLDGLTPSGPAWNWTPERVAAVQMVCGEGSVTPGGGHFAKAQVKYLGLNSKMTIVDYRARLGLFGRVAAKTTGAWVDAYESEPALAAAASEHCRGRRLSKKVTVHELDAFDADLRDGSRDAVIAVEALLRSADRGADVRNIARILKPGGRLLLIDFFREGHGNESSAIEAWGQSEPLPDNLPRLEHLQMALRRLHLRVTLSQDLSELYCRNLTRGLSRLATQLSRHPPESAQHEALLREVERWGARLKVLKSGEVSVLRLIGVKSR